MLEIKNIESAVAHNQDKIRDLESEGLFVELPNGEIRELCNITFIDGKVVLRTSTQIN